MDWIVHFDCNLFGVGAGSVKKTLKFRINMFFEEIFLSNI